MQIKGKNREWDLLLLICSLLLTLTYGNDGTHLWYRWKERCQEPYDSIHRALLMVRGLSFSLTYLHYQGVYHPHS